MNYLRLTAGSSRVSFHVSEMGVILLTSWAVVRSMCCFGLWDLKLGAERGASKSRSQTGQQGQQGQQGLCTWVPQACACRTRRWETPEGQAPAWKNRALWIPHSAGCRLQKRRWQLREVKRLPQGHTADSRQRWHRTHLPVRPLPFPVSTVPRDTQLSLP